MAENSTPKSGSVKVVESANFRFKQRYGKFFAISVFLSLFGHITFIIATPSFSGEVAMREESAMEALELPPEVVIPPPPKALAKPSVPIAAQEEVNEDITIDETTPPPPDLIPEVPVQEEKVEVEEFLMVAEVMPKLKSMPPRPEMPSYIARARVNVTTKIEFFVTKTGDVDPQRTKIAVSSGYPELDQIAVEWAKQMKFHPALNRGEPVAVRMAMPIVWKSK
ncbi:energy transducer TonB [bacterium]|nr:energy transducer TonB [bacterium]